MSRQSWSIEVSIKISRKTQQQPNQSINTEQKIGLELQICSDNNYALKEGQESNADKDGITISALMLVNNPGVIKKSNFFSLIIEISAIDGRISPSYFTAGNDSFTQH